MTTGEVVGTVVTTGDERECCCDYWGTGVAAVPTDEVMELGYRQIVESRCVD